MLAIVNGYVLNECTTVGGGEVSDEEAQMDEVERAMMLEFGAAGRAEHRETNTGQRECNASIVPQVLITL